MKYIAKNAVTVAVFLAICAAVGLVMGCPLKSIFGLPCPGCGMTRACLYLMRLDLAEAFRWHPLCFLVPPLGLMFVLKDTAFGKRFWSCKPLLIGLVAVMMAVYAVRLLLYFPSVPPMELEENSLIVKFVHKYLLQ